MSTLITQHGPARVDHDNLSQWLAARRQSVGASETPVLFGVGYANQSELLLWGEKTGQIEPDENEEVEQFEIGHLVQPTILELFRRRSAMDAVNTPPFEILHSRERSIVSATLDGKIRLTGEPVELKNVGAYRAKDWAEEPPLRVQVQVQQQIYVTESDHGYACALVGGNRFLWRRLDRNEKFIRAMLERIERFWERVQSGVPPNVDGSEATRRALAMLYPEDNGDARPLPPSANEWDYELLEVKEQLKELESRKRELENKLRAEMGDATYGILSDGTEYTLRTQTRAEHVVKESTFRVLRRKRAK